MRCLLLLLAITVANVYGQNTYNSGLRTDIESPWTTTVGGTLELYCIAVDAPGEMVWKHNGMPLSGERFHVQSSTSEDEGYITTMSLIDLTSRDAGSYECTDADDYFNKASIRVVINPAAPTVNIIEPEAYITTITRSGSVVNIRCEAAEGLTLKWTWNSDDVSDMDNVVIATMVNVHTHKQVSVLSISDSDLGVENTLRCSDASNANNEDSVQILVNEPEEEETEEEEEEEEAEAEAEEHEEEEEEEGEEEEVVEAGECAAERGALEDELATLRAAVRELCDRLPAE